MSIRAIIVTLLAVHAAHADAIRIQTDATLLKRASKRSTALLHVSAGELADLLAEKHGWVKVRVRDTTGWIPHASIVTLDNDEEVVTEEPAPAPVEVAVVEEPVAEPVDEVVEAPVPARERRFDIEVTAGLSVITQGFRTKGGTGVVPDNYNIGVTAATVALATGYRHRFSDTIVARADLAYAYRRSVPGIRLADPLTGDVVTTGFTIHDAGVTVAVGYDFRSELGVVLSARAGVRYHLFAIEDVLDPAANPAMVPSELRLAPTFGAGIDVARITDKLGVALALDTLIGAQTKQTGGLEDGVEADARGATVSSTVTYRWRPTLDVRASYDVELTKVDFGAPDPQSMRKHAGTASARFDVVHAMTIGLAKGF